MMMTGRTRPRRRSPPDRAGLVVVVGGIPSLHWTQRIPTRPGGPTGPPGTEWPAGGAASLPDTHPGAPPGRAAHFLHDPGTHPGFAALKRDRRAKDECCDVRGGRYRRWGRVSRAKPGSQRPGESVRAGSGEAGRRRSPGRTDLTSWPPSSMGMSAPSRRTLHQLNAVLAERPGVDRPEEPAQGHPVGPLEQGPVPSRAGMFDGVISRAEFDHLTANKFPDLTTRQNPARAALAGDAAPRAGGHPCDDTSGSIPTPTRTTDRSQSPWTAPRTAGPSYDAPSVCSTHPLGMTCAPNRRIARFPKINDHEAL